jgi:hypothetical protein
MTPTVSTAPQIAQGSVALVKKKFGFQLNYDPPSLIVIDLLVDKIKETGATEHQASGFLLGLGCYVGEVFVRHARASWRATAEMGMTRTCAYPILLSLRGTVTCDAIGIVFRRFAEGAAQSAAGLYESSVLRAPASAPAPEKGPA